MSDSQIRAASPETGKAGQRPAAQSLRFTPLRSRVVARPCHGVDRELVRSPIVPAPRLRHSA